MKEHFFLLNTRTSKLQCETPPVMISTFREHLYMSITQNYRSHKFDWQNFSDELNGHLNKYDGRAINFLIHTNLTGLWTTSILHKESKLCFMCGATTCSCQTKEIKLQSHKDVRLHSPPIVQYGHPLK